MLTAPTIGANFSFGGQHFTALADRALYWPQQRALIVADLHFEKGSALAASGQFLPPYDSHDILQRLCDQAEAVQARRIYCLGDSFHDQKAAARMPEAVSEGLRQLARRCDMLWIAGNHDGLSGSAWGGDVADELCIDGIMLRHESLASETRPEISGHYHPKLRLHLRGRSLSRPCFVQGGNRLLLPAFGSYTGGMDAESREIAALFAAKKYQAMLVAGEELLNFPLPRNKGKLR